MRTGVCECCHLDALLCSAAADGHRAKNATTCTNETGKLEVTGNYQFTSRSRLVDG